MYKCSDCYKGFTRSDNMSRHWKQMHGRINGAYPPPPPPPPQGAPPPPPPHGAHLGAHGAPPPPHGAQGASPPPPPPPRKGSNDSRSMVLLHPFTMMISGPTACGKTTMVKDLLQNHTDRIQRTIQRIVWLYKKWQSLYSLIQKTVLPRVEFIQGIPVDLEDDDFFDPRINNLLVLDDLFSEAGKDKRITDLFTEGSHHRSLSVISINQNSFGNKDQTQRRNCHYMVLFNNPVDKQSIMTLSRQMYPGQSDILLKQFANATKNAFGYLLVDLKPFTPENQRLKWTVSIPNTHNIANHVTPHDTIKEEHAPEVYHSSVGVQTVHIAEENLPDNMDKGQACDGCGQLFDSVHDVQRHVKSGWCPEHRDQKKRKYEDTSDREQDGSVEDNEAYSQLWKRARETNDEKFETIYDKFIDNGEESDYAQEMAEERIQPLFQTPNVCVYF